MSLKFDISECLNFHQIFPTHYKQNVIPSEGQQNQLILLLNETEKKPHKVTNPFEASSSSSHYSLDRKEIAHQSSIRRYPFFRSFLRLNLSLFPNSFCLATIKSVPPSQLATLLTTQQTHSLNPFSGKHPTKQNSKTSPTMYIHLCVRL